MKAIRLMRAWYAVWMLMSIILLLAVLFCCKSWPTSAVRLLSLLIFFLVCCFAWMWRRESKRLEIARLIVDNHLLMIPTAYYHGMDPKQHDLGMDIYISYFGILLGSRIIKFNQDKIALKRMEIRFDALSFIFGNNISEDSIQILWPCPSKEEAEHIAERFHYETGVVPVIRLN